MSRIKFLIFLSIAVVFIIFIFLRLNNRQEDKNVSVEQALLDPNLYDTSWLVNGNCELGCWEDLTPQQTSQEDAIMTVANLPFVNKDNLSINESSIYYFCNAPMDKTGCGTLIFEGGVLQDIILIPNYLITMDQAIDTLGRPDGYSCYPSDPGLTWYELFIYYPKRQMILVYRERSKDLLLGWEKDVCTKITMDGKLPMGYPVENVHFLQPYTIDEMEGVRPWVGFSE